MSYYHESSSQDRGLFGLITISAVAHVIFAVLIFAMPTGSKADETMKPKAIMFNIEVADRLGTGLGMTPKKGPDNPMGKITPLPPAPAQPATPPQETNVAVPDPNAKAIPENKKPVKKNPSDPNSALLNEAINQLNEGRTGEYTSPEGDPNATATGPGGTPGGDSCAVYRGRASRYIRRSGSVPEAAGKTVKITVVIGPSGGVISKSLSRSSGVPVADKIAMGMVPGSFGVPPAECGNVTLHVTVKFEGQQAPKLPPREERPRQPRPANNNVPSEVDRALQELP